MKFTPQPRFPVQLSATRRFPLSSTAIAVGTLLPGIVGLSILVGASIAAAPVTARAATPDALEKAAERLEAAGKISEAGDAYTKAANAYKQAGNTTAQLKALGKSAEMYEKYANALLKNVQTAPAPAPPRAPAAGRTTTTAPKAVAPVVPSATEDANPAPTKPLHLPPLRSRPGYAIGRAVFADGRPVPKFEVVVGGFDASGDVSHGFMPTVGYEKATNGRYAARIMDAFSHTKPVDARIASIRATADITYQGHDYKLALRDLGGETGMTTFLGQGRNGVVRDFVLPITGLRPGYTAESSSETLYRNAYFGGTITVDAATSGKPDANSEDETALTNASPQGTVELTLTPSAPLIDGSIGKPVRFLTPVAASKLGGNWRLCMRRGIPLGNYTATARLLLPDGESRALRIKDDIRTQIPWQSSIAVTFAPIRYDLLETPTLYVAQ